MIEVKRLIPNCAVLFEEMSWPSLHSACEASWKARYQPDCLTSTECMKLAAVQCAYTAIFSEYRTLQETRDLVSALRKACRNEPCEWCKERL